MKEDTNPFAAQDGSPLSGKEAAFFKWEKEKHKKELSLLLKEEQKKILEAEKALAKRITKNTL